MNIETGYIFANVHLYMYSVYSEWFSHCLVVTCSLCETPRVEEKQTEGFLVQLFVILRFKCQDKMLTLPLQYV